MATIAPVDDAYAKEYQNVNGTRVANQDYAVTGDYSATGEYAHVDTLSPAQNAAPQRRTYNYGGNPLAHMHTGESARLPAFGGDFQPGLYKQNKSRGFANPAPLGLSAFALTTFVLSLVNIGTRGVNEPNIVVALAFGYGGIVQLLAGMWEMAVGNTFGATALSSYGGFWLSFAIVLTPGGFEIVSSLGDQFDNSFGFFLAGWFIFTTILLICTLRSTVAFFLLFFFLDITFLLLMIGNLNAQSSWSGNVIAAGGYFGLFAAFMAWYNAFAGIADSSNSFFVVPVAHFPWSEKGREERRAKKASDSD